MTDPERFVNACEVEALIARLRNRPHTRVMWHWLRLETAPGETAGTLVVLGLS